jgi:uroporphyrinogen III methyltransferase/synthase
LTLCLLDTVPQTPITKMLHEGEILNIQNQEKTPPNPSGKVYLVGAGPGDPELLTYKAVKCIAAADLILYDYLVDEQTLKFARSGAELVSLGVPHTGRKIKQTEVNRRMVEAASRGRIVVRLKGGDPHIFGRLKEETLALKKAGIAYEVVPGITAASAAAQCADISLTDRHHASAVALITGHLSHEHDPSLPVLDFEQFAAFPGTLVFYMGVVTVELWSKSLLRGGMCAETPVLFVQNAARSDPKIIPTTLGNATATVEREHLQSPCIVVVGQVCCKNDFKHNGYCLRK